jgi:predicted ATP-grasp superfamily ATP-dependent carboligase
LAAIPGDVDVIAATPEPHRILLLGNYRATITVARELGKRGHTIVVGCAGDEEGGAEHSRYCARSWQHPPAASGRVFIDALRDMLLSDPDISVVLPVSERYVRLVNAHRAELPQDRIYAMPDAAAVDICLDKARTLALALHADVPVAPFRNVTTLAELGDAADALGFPLVLRPFDSMQRLFGLKALVLRSREELVARFAEWPGEHASLLVQRKVSGIRHNVYFAAEGGRPIRLLEVAVLRTDKPDGTGLAVEGVTQKLRSVSRHYTTRLLSALAYHGVGCAQFLVDPASGRTHFLEINPRIAGHHAVAERAGLGLSELAVALATRRTPDEPFHEGTAGIRYAWSYGELRALKSRFASGEIDLGGLARGLAAVADTALRADMQVGWELSDPRPTFETCRRAFAPALQPQLWMRHAAEMIRRVASRPVLLVSRRSNRSKGPRPSPAASP